MLYEKFKIFKMKISHFLFFSLLMITPRYGNSSVHIASIDIPIPEVGKRCPDFRLTEVTNFSKKEVTLNDFKGKWLFIDFWSTSCVSAIRSLSQINELQKKFKDEIQFLMVGKNNKRYNRNIKEVFDKMSSYQKLNIAAAYDSTLGNHWRINSTPHIVVIDPQGVVRAITDGRDMNEITVQQLLNGDQVNPFFPKDKIRPIFNPITKSEIKNCKYYSQMVKWNGEKQYVGYSVDRYLQLIKSTEDFKLAMVTLNWLYNTAYFGEYYFKNPYDSNYAEIYPVPILEVRDASNFQYDYKDRAGKGLYNYSLWIHPDQLTKETLMRYMQQDLERAFGYVATIEYRNMPVWELTASSGTEKIIKTKGDTPYNSAKQQSPAVGFKVRNISPRDFLITLTYYLTGTETHPFIESTGIEDNIDFEIEADMTDLENVKQALQKAGLDLKLGTKRMKTLVIKDAS